MLSLFTTEKHLTGFSRPVQRFTSTLNIPRIPTSAFNLFFINIFPVNIPLELISLLMGSKGNIRALITMSVIWLFRFLFHVLAETIFNSFQSSRLYFSKCGTNTKIVFCCLCWLMQMCNIEQSNMKMYRATILMQ